MIRELRTSPIAYPFWLALIPAILNGGATQARAEQQYKFEVASIKANVSKEQRGSLQFPANGRFVATWSDRLVVDRTGLKDLYRLETEGWVPMRARQIPPGVEPSAEQLAMADPDRPTLFLVFDRLGLKLEAQKAPIEIYTFEHVEKPTEN